MSLTDLAEIVGLILAIAYLLLAVRQNIWCWAAALGSTLLYGFVFFDAGLLMESALQGFYMAMAVYGWWQWSRGGQDRHGLAVTTWPVRNHVAAAIVVLLASALSGSLLASGTGAAMPYLDSFTTWAAVLTTWMVARKILENWIYWFVIDSVSIYLYVSRGLLPTALLFAAYLVIIVVGYRAWRRELGQQRSGERPAVAGRA